MAPTTTQNDEWDLPKLKAAINFEDDVQAAAAHNKDTGTLSPPGP
jgi:hypothetical protein